MATSYAKKVGFSNTNTVHTFARAPVQTKPVIDTKPKVTSGLNTTHGLTKLTSTSDLNTLLSQISDFKFKDYFLDFDRLRKGFVSESRFRSGLGMVNTEFDEADVLTILNRYRIDDEKIDYRSFCEDADK